MKKRLVTALCSTLFVASALPSLAVTNEITGFYRVRGILANLAKAADDTPDSLVDQRFRAKWTLGVNEYVKLVYFGEVDFQWGDQSYTTSRNEGGAQGGDTVNLETKNLYAELKIPNTAFTATMGLQGYADNWDQVFLLSDMAGLKLAGKFGNTDANVAWFKLQEEAGNSANTSRTAAPNVGVNNADDVTLFAAQVSTKVSDALKVGADLYWYQNLGGTTTTGANYQGFASDLNMDGDAVISVTGLGEFDADDAVDFSLDNPAAMKAANVYYPGLNATFKMGNLTLSGWAFASFGTLEEAIYDTDDLELTLDPDLGNPANSEITVALADDAKAKDVDVFGYAASVRADMNLGAAQVGARILFFSADDDALDDKYEAPYFPMKNVAAEAAPFSKDGLMIMLADGGQATYPTLYGQAAGFAMGDAAYAGYGLLGATVNASYVPPTMKKLYLKASAGYFLSLEDDRVNEEDFNGSTSFNVGENEVGVDVSFDNEKEHKGTNLGTEIAVHVGYMVTDNFDLSLNAAYAFLGDFYDDTAVSMKDGQVDDPDAPYVVALMANVNF